MRISDWSSDVCSSDLVGIGEAGVIVGLRLGKQHPHRLDQAQPDDAADRGARGRVDAVRGERFLDRAADVGLAVDERAIAIEDREPVHQPRRRPRSDRKRVVLGKSVSVRVDLGDRRHLKTTQYVYRHTLTYITDTYE